MFISLAWRANHRKRFFDRSQEKKHLDKFKECE